ncbi:MAG TPA: alpha/beta fold hydrolase [Ktedonobacterales bacterium]|nr:alpha/beta fold hydrolase [Ktedonobacterales bacterium]
MATPGDHSRGTPEEFLLSVSGLKGRKHLTIYPAATPAASPSTIFIPGMRGHAGTYSTLVPSGNFLAALAEAGLNVVAVDLPGHGQSEGPRGLFTYHSIIKTLRAAVAYTAERFGTPVGVTGSSMGGILSLYAALEVPEIQAAAPMNVLDLRNIDPALHLLRHKIIVPPTRMLARIGAGPLLTWAPVPVDAFLSTKEVWDDKQHARAWLRDPLSTSAYRTSAWISVFMSPEDKPALEDLKTPTRILVGARDKVLPAEMTRAIFERLTCEKDLVILPDAGHMLPTEYLEQSAPLVADWLKSHLMVQAAPATKPAANDQEAPAAPAVPRKRATPRQPKKSTGAQPG